MPEIVSLRQHVSAQVRLGDALGEGVQPPLPHPPDVGGKGLCPGDHGAHQPVDRLAQLMEFGLVIGHNAYGAMFMEVPGDFRQGKAELGDLLHGELKKALVVGLKVKFAALF